MAKKKFAKTKKPNWSDQVAEFLIQQIKDGTAPWMKPWAPGEGGLPLNPVTNKPYRGMNAIWLMMQERSDHRWMTYKQADSIGAQVRKGEKSTFITYWKTHEEKTITNPAGEKIKERDDLDRPRSFSACVFNGEQVDGLPELAPKKVVEWEAHRLAEAILTGSGADIRHASQNRACYSPQRDSITLPMREQFGTASDYYSTALHELSHWTGHESRLNRNLENEFGSTEYAREELRAEIASMLIGRDIGIGYQPQQTAAYAKSWIEALHSDHMEIHRATRDASKIQSYVLEFGKSLDLKEGESASEGKPEDSSSIIAEHSSTAKGDHKMRFLQTASSSFKPTLEQILFEQKHPRAAQARKESAKQIVEQILNMVEVGPYPWGGVPMGSSGAINAVTGKPFTGASQWALLFHMNKEVLSDPRFVMNRDLTGSNGLSLTKNAQPVVLSTPSLAAPRASAEALLEASTGTDHKVLVDQPRHAYHASVVTGAENLPVPAVLDYKAAIDNLIAASGAKVVVGDFPEPRFSGVFDEIRLPENATSNEEHYANLMNVWCQWVSAPNREQGRLAEVWTDAGVPAYITEAFFTASCKLLTSCNFGLPVLLNESERFSLNVLDQVFKENPGVLLAQAERAADVFAKASTIIEDHQQKSVATSNEEESLSPS